MLIASGDVEMPVMGGIAAIREVRELESAGRMSGHCPFIAVTANARHEQLQEMRDAGMDDTVPKPFHFPNLLSKITEVMENVNLPQIPISSGTGHDVSGAQLERKKNRNTNGSTEYKLGPRPNVDSYDTKSSGTKNNDSAKSIPIDACCPVAAERQGHTILAQIRHRKISDLWSSEAASQDGLDSFKLILLNTRQPRDIAQTVWRRAGKSSNSVRICADGATDRLHDEVFACSLESLDRSDYPNIIIGDLDSIKPSTKNFYSQSSSNVKVIRVEDQNSTDFTKAINHVSLPTQADEDERDIVVLGGIDGRIDQTFSSINSLFLRPRIYMIDECNVLMLLQAGSHEIDCTGLGRHCGLVPLRAPVRCWSSGLQWCLNGETMDLGGLISTNNRIVSKDSKVHVRVDGAVLFSVELKLT